MIFDKNNILFDNNNRCDIANFRPIIFGNDKYHPTKFGNFGLINYELYVFECNVAKFERKHGRAPFLASEFALMFADDLNIMLDKADILAIVEETGSGAPNNEIAMLRGMFDGWQALRNRIIEQCKRQNIKLAPNQVKELAKRGGRDW